MKKQTLFLALILILAVCTGLFAQQNSGFMPFVSQIKAEARNNLIRLTWRDSPDARGPVFIFRSTRPFGDSIPPNIRPVVVRYGEQYYIDDTDDMDDLYYFIAASDVSGRRFDIVIPQTNSINLNYSFDSADAASAGETGTGSPNGSHIGSPIGGAETTTSAIIQSPEPVHGVFNLRARRDGEKIVISFDSAGPRKTTLLYRSMHPIQQPQDLLNAVIVHSGLDSPYEDFPVPGLSWYYAVIYEDDIAGGNMGIRPGVNSTVSAVMLSDDNSFEQFLRPIPLPIMSLHDGRPDNSRNDIRSGSLAAGVDFSRIQMPPKVPLDKKVPRVFSVDMRSPAGGEESALFQIVNEYFRVHDWENSRAGLLHYLSLPRSRDIEVRARFYLGQSNYFMENYREALFEFLYVRTQFHEEAQAWIDAVLAAMVY